MTQVSKISFNGKVLFFFPPDRQLTKEIETPGIFPSAPRISLGLASIASYVKHRAGINAYVYCSPDHSPEQIATIIQSEKPDVIGVSCWSYNRFACLSLANIAKKINPNIIIVFGGIHASLLDKQLLSHYPEVDYIIRGEGEVPFFKLLAALGQDTDIASIDGLTFRSNGKLVRTPNHSRCKSLDELPLIDYKTVSIGTSHLFESKYSLASRKKMSDAREIWQQVVINKISKTLPVETARGCPFSCTFCSGNGFMGSGVARRSIQNVIEQIRRIVEMGSEGIHFNDMNFTLDRLYTKSLCMALIKHKIKLPWTCWTRIDLVDKELLILLRKAGCEGIFYGVDSLSKKVLYSVGRMYEPSCAIKHLNLTISLGIKTQTNIIIGFPGETNQDRLESLRNIRMIHKDIHFLVNGLLILPGAEIYRIALRDGFDESYWLSNHAEVLPFYTGTLSKEERKDWIDRFESHGVSKRK